jgi:hypothetical protein
MRRILMLGFAWTIAGAVSHAAPPPNRRDEPARSPSAPSVDADFDEDRRKPPDVDFGKAEVVLQYRESVHIVGADPESTKRERQLVGVRGFPSSDSVVHKIRAGYWGRTPQESVLPFGGRADDIGVTVLIGPIPLPQGPGIDDRTLAQFAACPWLEALNVELTEVTDDGIAQLRPLNHLLMLDLAYTHVTDEGMKTVGALASLKILALNDTRITDAGLKELRNRDDLATLYLGGTPVTGAAFSDLGGLTGLSALYLHGSHLNDGGLARVCELPSIRVLSIGQTEVTDRGAASITTLRGIEELDLGCTQITDKTVRRLVECRNLRALYLDHTQTTDKGIAALADLKRLRILDVTGTEVTASALAELCARNPGLRIAKIRKQRFDFKAVRSDVPRHPPRRGVGEPDESSDAVRLHDFLFSFMASRISLSDLK